MMTDKEARLFELRDHIARANAKLAELDRTLEGARTARHQDALWNVKVMTAKELEAAIQRSTREIAELA